MTGQVFKVGGNVRDALMGSYSTPHYKDPPSDFKPSAIVIEPRVETEVSDASLAVFMKIFGVTEEDPS